jgi:hypothetical protein
LAADTLPTPDEIAARAHALFVEDGRRLTKLSEYWLQAEQELRDLGARRTLERSAKPRRAQRAPRAGRDGRD